MWDEFVQQLFTSIYLNVLYIYDVYCFGKCGVKWNGVSWRSGIILACLIVEILIYPLIWINLKWLHNFWHHILHMISGIFNRCRSVFRSEINLFLILILSAILVRVQMFLLYNNINKYSNVFPIIKKMYILFGFQYQSIIFNNTLKQNGEIQKKIVRFAIAKMTATCP